MNEPTHRCGAHLDHLARRMRLHAERVLDPLGLRPRHLVALTVLRDRSGITQQALSATLMLDRANIVGLLNDLEGAGLVERIRSTLDRRRHLVQLTEAGASRLATAECALAAAEDEVLSALDHAQREQLYSLLQQATADDCSAAADNTSCAAVVAEN
ncbi:MarR family winged helix-turn-helix transcriptional regulator [Rhodococcus wratislaviensis]|uniref:MarR family winged helix-turn-helix transcriptional regulator n=1 Tax=Rhodococcus wratislaviensis TaxID=44752 RepID=UPI0020D128F9|nr:MarR family transcriptional regulator [Rhodococcus wratislaviensis]